MKEILKKLSIQDLEVLKKQSDNDLESNLIYGTILLILYIDRSANLFELISVFNKEKLYFEKNKIKNRRNRLPNLDILIKNADTIVSNLLEESDSSFYFIEKSLNRSDIYRDRMVLNILVEKFYSDEFSELYYSIKNEQCKKFILRIVEELKLKKSNL